MTFERNNLFANNRLGDLVFVQLGSVGSQHGFAVTKHRNLVSECHHFVQEVRNEQDCFVFAFGQSPHSCVNQFTLLRSQRSRGFVHDDQIGAGADSRQN